jgi:ketosteroid isomerase-like protein
MEIAAPDINAVISKLNEQFEQAFKRSDAYAIAILYTTDAMLLPPGSDLVKGKSEIENFWQGTMSMGVKCVKLDTEELEQHHHTVIERGTYALIGVDKELIDKGKYLVIWKKEFDEWKIQKDIWNSSIPEI